MGKLKWKAILAILVVVGILGLLFMTDVGQKYTDFLKKSVGNFVSVIFKKQPSGPLFGIEFSASKDALYGQTFNMVNSTFVANGFYQSIKIGDSDISIKSGDEINVFIDNFNGAFVYTADGGVKLSGESNQIEINDLVYTSAKPNKIDLEIIPFNFTLNNVIQDKISLKSVYGDIKTDRGQAPLTNDNIEISFFTGDMGLTNDGNAMLTGFANSVTGDRFSFK